MDESLNAYLTAGVAIDCHHPAIQAQAAALRREGMTPVAHAARLFHWVRDSVAHSCDSAASTVPWRASEVLQQGHGLCYAKSHLLAALLRAAGHPAGLDYQRLATERGRFFLHGLVTVWLPGYGWRRLDARGGYPLPAFAVESDALLYPASGPGEVTYGVNLVEPDPALLRVLQGGESLAEVLAALPSALTMG